MIDNPNILNKIKAILEIKIKKLYVYFTNEKLREKFIHPNFFTFDKLESYFLSKMAVNSLTPDILNRLSKSSLKVIYSSLTSSKSSIEKIQFLFEKNYSFYAQKMNREFFIKYRSKALLDKNTIYTFIESLCAEQINGLDSNIRDYMQKLPASDHQSMIINITKDVSNQEQFNQIIINYFNKWNISSHKRLFILQKLKTFSPKISSYLKEENNLDEKVAKFESELLSILLSNNQSKIDLLINYEDVITDLCFSEILLKSNNSIIRNLFANNNLKLNKNFMKLLLFHFTLNEKNKMSLNELKVEFRDLNKLSTEGDYFRRESRILINTSRISEYINKNLNLFDTIFHELEHENQERISKTENPPIEYLQIIKDLVLNDFIYNFWINNYYNYSFEYNANMISLKKIQQFIYELNDFKIQYCSKNLKYQNSNLREVKVNPETNKSLSLEEAFDYCLSKEVIARYRQKYPLLRIEYDELGQKIDIVAIKEKLKLLIEYEKRKNLDKEERKKIISEIKTYSDYLNSLKGKTLTYC